MCRRLTCLMRGPNFKAILGLKGRILIAAVLVTLAGFASAVWWAFGIDEAKKQEYESVTHHHEFTSGQITLSTDLLRRLALVREGADGNAALVAEIERDLDTFLADGRRKARSIEVDYFFVADQFKASLKRAVDHVLDVEETFAESTRHLLYAKAGAESDRLRQELRSANIESIRSHLALEGQLNQISHMRLGSLHVQGQIAYSTLFGLLLILCALSALPIAGRMHSLLKQAQADREVIQDAYDEMVATKDELDARKVELEVALEEAQAQTALFEHASNRFQQLFGGLPVGCLTYDLGGTIQEWNQAMTDLIGLEGHHVVFQHFSLIYQEYEGGPDLFDITSSVLTNGGKREFEWMHRLQDGSSRHVLYVTYALRNIRGEILGGILAGIDITGRREAQKALEVSEERLALALNASSTGIFDWSITEDVQFWSPKVCEILRITDPEFQPDSHEFTLRTHPEDLGIFEDELRDHLEGLTETLEMEVRVRCDDGSYIWAQIKGEAVRGEDGKAIRMTGSIEDVSERKQVLLELAESEARFRDVTDAAGEFVFEINPAGCFSFLTGRFEEMMGYSIQTMLSKPLTKIVQKRHHRTTSLLLKRSMKNKVKLSDVVVRCIHADGSERVLRISATPNWDSQGVFCGYRGTAMDITQQKQAEEELAMANQMLHDTLESIRDSFFSINREWQVSYANSSAAESMGAKAEALIGKKLYDVLPSEVFTTVSANVSEAMEHMRERTFETWNPNTKQWLLYRIYPRLAGASIFSQDITDRKSFEAQIEAQMLEINEKNVILQLQQKNLEEANKRLEALASTDGLTGLKNHKAFQTALAELHKDSLAMNVPLSVVLLDVDHFKNYNDTYGHPAGDEVLRTVATILKQHGRRGDIAARYGGEEFVLVLPNTPASEAIKAAERVRKAIADHPWQQGGITASLGVSELRAGFDKHDLISQADLALYSAKRTGRNKVVNWTPEVQETRAA
jgi:diguanylate cyclase (GGDEF)-like protein/PAS domain S-box-containing protein